MFRLECVTRAGLLPANADAPTDLQTRRASQNFLPMKSLDEVQTHGFHFRNIFTTLSVLTAVSFSARFWPSEKANFSPCHVLAENEAFSFPSLPLFTLGS